MKKNKVAFLLSAVLSTATVASGFVACGPQGEEKPSADETTYVKLLHYDAGYGRKYIEEAAKNFQDAVKDVSYEEGKKGVYIDIEHGKTETTGQSLLNTLSTSNYDMFLTSDVTPTALKNNGNVMDISSLMNATSSDATPVSDFADETSIYSRMYPDWQNYIANEDGSMYGLPVFMVSYHLYYDAALVAERGLYIKDGSTDTSLTFTNNIQAAQKGVDGVKGTADDGLPETYAQFYLWCAKIESSNITPIHYSGLYQQHFDWALNQFWADFEGAANTKACWTFDGTVMDDLINVDDSGNVTYLDPTAITLDNGYMVQKQEGRYRVMQLAKKIADTVNTSDPWVHNYAFSPSETHTEAQGTYVSSKFSATPIMMFAEGSYWEAEATDKFEAYENRNGGKLDRKFAVLPTPKYSREDVGVNSRSTVLVGNGLTMFLNKKVENAVNKQAVIDFLMYFNQEGNMDEQHAASASMRPYNYEIDDDVSAKMSYLLKDYKALMDSDRTDVVFSSADNDFNRANSDKLNNYYWIFYSRYLGEDSDATSYTSVKTFKENYRHDGPNGIVTAEEYFNGFYLHYTVNNNAVWKDMLKKIGR